MPSTELGLAEIGERLRSLRRRSNRIVATHAAAAVLAVACLSTALRFGLGRERFQGAPAWLALAACLATTAWAVWYGRAHWIDVKRAARLADQQGKLHDRLTTLLALSESNRTNRLLPVLMSQSLELGERWQPQRLLPQSYPKSVYVAAVAFLVMATSPLLEPDSIPPHEIPTPPASSAAVAEGEDAETAREQVALAAASLDTGTTDENGADKANGNDQTDQGHGKGESEAKRSTDQGKTVQGKPTGNSPPLGAKASAQLPPPSGGSMPQGARADSEEGQTTNDQNDRSPRGDGKPEDRKGQGKEDAGNQRLGQQVKPNGKQGGDPRQPQAQQGVDPSTASAQLPNPGKDQNKTADKDPKQKGQGSSPDAGAGSEAATILTVRGGDATADGAALGTFKLTLNSFLDRVEDKSHRHRDDKHPPAKNSTTEDAVPTRPEGELDDDALRKVTIPAEYEEIVKRVYARH